MGRTPKQFKNAKEDTVTDSIIGLCGSNSNLNYLDGFPEVKVIVNDGFNGDEKVALISGGGSGHEPAFGGYVGDGMLAAAVVGDVFSSPPAEAVLAAIQHVTGKAGCLVIVMNYTGDRLNFGLAVEQAKAKGLKVDMLKVGDDCALPGTGLAGRRGIAGTVLVAKVAGGAAWRGDSLEKVKQVAEEASKSVGSMGVSTSVCTPPGGTISDRLGENEMEIGLGIHGEPGAAKKQLQPAQSIVKEVIEKIVEYSGIDESTDELALLVNNLGTASQLEMGIITGAAITFLTQKRSFQITRLYTGTFMTALDMHGFSISLMKVTESIKSLLDGQCQVSGWSNKLGKFQTKSPIKLQQQDTKATRGRPKELSSFGRAAEACMSSAAASIISQADQLDAWDQRVGDGDCGSTVKRGAKAVEEALKEAPLNDAGPLALCLADCARTMGGTSGALYNIFFTAAASKLPEAGSAGTHEIAQALSAGVEAIEKYGGAKPGYRTMLDALHPASEAFSSAAQKGKEPREAAEEAARAADEGAQGTKNVTAGAGRSSYIPEAELKGIPDPGAMAVAFWIQAVAQSL